MGVLSYCIFQRLTVHAAHPGFVFRVRYCWVRAVFARRRCWYTLFVCFWGSYARQGLGNSGWRGRVELAVRYISVPRCCVRVQADRRWHDLPTFPVYWNCFFFVWYEVRKDRSPVRPLVWLAQLHWRSVFQFDRVRVLVFV